MKAEEIIAKVERLVAIGTTTEQIAKSIGRNPGAIGALLSRHGHRDLARPFDRLYAEGQRALRAARAELPIQPAGITSERALEIALGAEPRLIERELVAA